MIIIQKHLKVHGNTVKINYENNNSAIVDFDETNVTDLFNFEEKITNFEEKITGQTGNDGTKVVETMVPLKYLRDFWRTPEIPLINCEINLILTWLGNCVIVSDVVANQGGTFLITDTKIYVPIVTL